MVIRRAVIPAERIERTIFLVRGQRVMLSGDLASLYGVEPRALVQAVKRNRERFPRDFMFQRSGREFLILKSQIVISRWGGARRSRPFAFTEQGVAMMSSVLRSARAVRVNIEIMRTFVRLRRALAQDARLAKRIAALERRVHTHYRIPSDALGALVEQESEPGERIGFRPRGG